MKNWIVGAAAASVLIGLTACGSGEHQEKPRPSAVTVTSHTTVTQTPTESTIVVEEPAPTVVEPELYGWCATAGEVYGSMVCGGENGDVWVPNVPIEPTINQHPDVTGEPCAPGVDSTKLVDGQTYYCSGEHGVWIAR